MNPLKSVNGTIAAGFILAIIFLLAHGLGTFNLWSTIVWLHVFAGVIWIGLLYYFTFIQVPAVGEAAADEGGPGPASFRTTHPYRTGLLGAAVLWPVVIQALLRRRRRPAVEPLTGSRPCNVHTGTQGRRHQAIDQV